MIRMKKKDKKLRISTKNSYKKEEKSYKKGLPPAGEDITQ